jgi:hypothetical protein
MWFLITSTFCMTFFLLPESAHTQTVPLTVKYSCSEINQGYDYEFKIKLFIDNREFGESPPQLCSIVNQVIFNVPTGYHHVRIIGYKKYQGAWEESLKSKGYTVDSQYEQSLDLSGPTSIDLQFRLATGTLTRGFITAGSSVTAGSADTPQIPKTPK